MTKSVYVMIDGNPLELVLELELELVLYKYVSTFCKDQLTSSK